MRCAGRRVSPRDAYDAPPGAAPFHRSLQTRRAPDTFEPSARACHAPRVTPSPADRPTRPGLLPKLADVTPIEPDPKVRRVETDVSRRVVPATGHILDVIA